MTGQNGTAQDGTAQGGIAQDGTAQDGTAQDGTAQDGTAQDGTAQDGTAQDGTAADGAPVAAAGSGDSVQQAARVGRVSGSSVVTAFSVVVMVASASFFVYRTGVIPGWRPQARVAATPATTAPTPTPTPTSATPSTAGPVPVVQAAPRTSTRSSRAAEDNEAPTAWAAAATRALRSTVSVTAEMDGERWTSSGFVLDAGGHIVTTSRQVPKGSQKLTVTRADGTSFGARLVARDIYSDVAVLRVVDGPRTWVPVAWLTSPKVTAGVKVLTAGLDDLGEQEVQVQVVRAVTATRLMVPEADEEVGTALIVHVLGSPESGLAAGRIAVDRSGRVVGMGVDQLSKSAGAEVEETGHLLPGPLVRRVALQLARGKSPQRPYLGCLVVPGRVPLGSGFTDAAIVRTVVKGSPADRAGLQVGDAILDFSGNRTKSDVDLEAALLTRDPGETVKVQVAAKGERYTVGVRLGVRTT